MTMQISAYNKRRNSMLTRWFHRVGPRLWLLLMSIPCILEAATPETINQYRYTYELAKDAIKSNDEVAFKAHYQALSGYPLTVYLDYQRAAKQLSVLKQQPSQTDSAKIDNAHEFVSRFIHEHADTYLGDKLHREYVDTLAETQRWQQLVHWYRPSMRKRSTHCRWLEARIALNDLTALSEVAKVWTQPSSLPASCDTLFARWMESPFFKEDTVWKRYVLAVTASNNRLARYLSSLLPSSYDYYIELAQALAKAPNTIAQYTRFSTHSPEMQDLIVYGVKQLARIAPEDALYHWRHYEALHIFDLDRITDTKSYLATRLIREGQGEIVEQMLAVSPSLRRPGTIEGLIRAQLKEQRWENIIATIALLPLPLKESHRWQYWQTRANEQLGLAGTDTYLELAQSRSFYGFLAADKLGLNYRFDTEPLVYSQTAYDRASAISDFIRAKELWLSGHYGEAYAEWYYGLTRLEEDEITAAAALARDWGWHDRAINAMIAGKHWSHLDVRFPLAFEDAFAKAAEDTKLHPELLFAVARQESAMTEGAVSSAGARGLMQLMPATARQTAEKLGISHRTEDLFDAEHNIRLGSRYLHELFEQFDHNRILATAAYNAGPHRVEKWISDTAKELPFDVWIETIPFKETRGYVQNVLTYSVIYSYRMGNPTLLVTRNEAKTKL